MSKRFKYWRLLNFSNICTQFCPILAWWVLPPSTTIYKWNTTKIKLQQHSNIATHKMIYVIYLRNTFQVSPPPSYHDIPGTVPAHQVSTITLSLINTFRTKTKFLNLDKINSNIWLILPIKDELICNHSQWSSDLLYFSAGCLKRSSTFLWRGCRPKWWVVTSNDVTSN